MGDFNGNCNKWYKEGSSDSNGMKLFNFTEYNSLYQIVDKPTRTTDRSKSLLDLVLTDSPRSISSTNIIPGISDHCIVLTNLKLTIKPDRRKYTRTFYDMKNVNLENLNNAIESAPFDTAYIFDEIDDVFNIWNDILMNAIKQIIPIRRYY